MKRRDFITLVGSTAFAWPLSAGAQQSAIPVVGYLSQGSPETDAVRVTGLQRGLRHPGALRCSIPMRLGMRADTCSLVHQR
jgi:putative ABC transport system substrate-binding protein